MLDLMDATEETNRLLATMIRMQCETQSQAILELHRVGFSAVRIGELVGTTQNTANVTIQRAKRTAGRKKKTADA
jgi:DNA-directed RNA polymerase specialized sigma24 family protein